MKMQWYIRHADIWYGSMKQNKRFVMTHVLASPVSQQVASDAKFWARLFFAEFNCYLAPELSVLVVKSFKGH